MRHFISSVLVCYGLVTVACSGSDSSNGGGQASPEAKAACAQWADAFCAHVARCSPGDLDFYGSDEARCRSVRAATCELEHALPSTGLTVQWRLDCTTERVNATCDEARIASCSTPVGKLGPGAACADDLQCASKECSGATSDSCGTCEAAPLGVGDPCELGGTKCQPDLACWSGSCRAYVPIGDSCTSDDLCEELAPCVDGVCTLGPSDGDACLAGDVCAAFWSCVAGTCQRDDILAPHPGATCGIGTGSTCGLGYYCAGEGSTGTCRPQGAEGDTCGPYVMVTESCLSPFVCVGGTCAKPEIPSCG